MDKKVKIQELKRGDIILYEGMPDDMLDQAIMLGTNSKVTHTAIFDCFKDNFIYVVEENIPHAVIIRTNDKSVDDDRYNRLNRNAYVFRRKSSEELFQNEKNPVTIAEYYSQEPALEFAWYSFLPIGIYMLGDKAIQDKKYRAIVMDVLELAMMELIQWVNPAGRKGYPMSCSMFAYHCFKKAGKKYELTLATNRMDNLIEDLIKLLIDNQSSLEKHANKMCLADCMMSEEDKEAKKQKIVNELKEYRKNEKDGKIKLAKNPHNLSIDTTYLEKVYTFLKEFIKRIEKNFDMKDLDPAKLLKLLSSDMYEYFIAPGDIFKATNLEYLGIIDYSSINS